MPLKLSDMQLILLATAVQREDGSLLPPPASLGDQAVRIRKAVSALIKRRLAEEAFVNDSAQTWREDEEDHIGVVITDAGRSVIVTEEGEAGSDGDAPQTEPISTNAAMGDAELPVADRPAISADPPSAPRAGSKQALLVEMLGRDDGASLTELADATGWLPHTTRAALTGLRKKGHMLEKGKREEITRYTIRTAA